MSHIQVSYETFAFNPDQWEIVSAAMKRASELVASMSSYTASKSSLMSWVCLDFLASNDFLFADDPAIRCRYLSKLEKMSGRKLIMVDEKTGAIEYGYDTLLQLGE